MFNLSRNSVSFYLFHTSPSMSIFLLHCYIVYVRMPFSVFFPFLNPSIFLWCRCPCVKSAVFRLTNGSSFLAGLLRLIPQTLFRLFQSFSSFSIHPFQYSSSFSILVNHIRLSISSSVFSLFLCIPFS